MQLLDQFGNPIPAAAIARLREDIAPIGAIHGRPPFPGHLAFGIDPARLGAILRAADSGNTLEWHIIAEEMEELFPHYHAVMSKRRRQVAQLPITVTAAEHTDGAPSEEFKKHAEFVRAWVKTGVLSRAMFDITDAIGKGFSVSKIVWETKPGSFTPCEIAYMPQRFFELSWQDGSTVWLRSEGGFVDLEPHHWLVHTHKSKSGLAQRSGLARAVAFIWLYATYTSRDWALFCQAYGLPIRVGRYGPEASERDKRVLWQAVSSIAGDVAAIIPKSMEMEFVKDSDRTAGAQLYEKRADWLNREVSKLVLGSTAGTEAINGSHAVGQEHRQVEHDVETFDAGLLATSVNRQIVQAMVAFTFGPQEAYPVLTIGRPEQVPLQHVIAAVADLGSMGLKVKASEIRERLQLSEPDAGDEVIGGPPAKVEKPEIPGMPVTPRVNAQSEGPRRLLGTLITRHGEVPPEMVEHLTDRLAEDAAGALAGMTDAVRHAMEAAEDLHDLARRIHRLKLPEKEFAEAMARGLALAELVGQASLVDELRGAR